MTTETFADFVASQESRKQIVDSILTYTQNLCDALKKNYINFNIRGHEHSIEIGEDDYGYHSKKIEQLKQGICNYEYTVETGRKYHKIIMNTPGQRSVHAFVDKKTGSLYKPASWKGPAKIERYNLLSENDRKWLTDNADWSGNYLYLN
jgi:hypothetical protein